MRRRECAYEVLLAESIDPVLYAYPGIRLAESGRRDPDMADSAMSCRRRQTHDIQQCAAADSDHIRMPINMVAVQPRMNFRNVEVGVFRPLATFDYNWRTNQLKPFGVRLEISFDAARQIGLCSSQSFVQDHHDFMWAPVLLLIQNRFQNQIHWFEHIFRELHLQFVRNLKGAPYHGHKTLSNAHILSA